jgi:hypothetical protein
MDDVAEAWLGGSAGPSPETLQELRVRLEQWLAEAPDGGRRQGQVSPGSPDQEQGRAAALDLLDLIRETEQGGISGVDAEPLHRFSEQLKSRRRDRRSDRGRTLPLAETEVEQLVHALRDVEHAWEDFKERFAFRRQREQVIEILRRPPGRRRWSDVAQALEVRMHGHTEEVTRTYLELLRVKGLRCALLYYLDWNPGRRWIHFPRATPLKPSEALDVLTDWYDFRSRAACHKELVRQRQRRRRRGEDASYPLPRGD